MALKSDPTGVRLATERELCRRSLLEFVRQGWEALPKHQGRPFISGWAVEAIVEHLEAVAAGEITHLLINVPPGFTKSMTVNVFFPAWLWGPCGQPNTSFISCSHDADTSTRQNLYCRDLINSDWYQERWGNVFSWKGDQNLKTLYENSRGGSRYAGAVRKGLTGKRADYVITDDPHDVEKAESPDVLERAVRWYSESLPTRVNDQERSPFITIMQRVHERDVSGHILEHDLGYVHLCLPMEYEPDHPHQSTRFDDPRTEPGELLWPERFSRKAVDSLKEKFRSFGGTYAEAGQLQQRPAPRGGGMFQKKDFRTRRIAPDDSEIAAGPVRGWDLAATAKDVASFTASVKMCRLKDGTTVILDAEHRQLESKDVYALILRTAAADGPNVRQSIPQDPGQAGKDQKRHVASLLAGYDVHFSPESGSKETRAGPLAAQGAAGNLDVLTGLWNDEFIAEACSFPRGRYKDYVDAASRAFARLVVGAGEMMVGAAPKLIRPGGVYRS